MKGSQRDAPASTQPPRPTTNFSAYRLIGVIGDWNIAPIDEDGRAWRAARELCDRMPSAAHIDKLLDERVAALSPLVETETFREEPGVRDIENIDAELRLLARAWRASRELCDRMPSTAHIDELLDERSATMVLSTTIGPAWAR